MGFSSADFQLQFDQGRPECSWLHVIEKDVGTVVAEFSGDIATRIRQLFFDSLYNNHYFNCYSAVRFVAGRTKDRCWETFMPEQGNKLYVNDALQQFTIPFVFQICGLARIFDEQSKEEIMRHQVIHAGLIIGSDTNGIPVVLDKDCARNLHIRRWPSVEGQYFGSSYKEIRPEYVTCSEMMDLPWKAE